MKRLSLRAVRRLLMCSLTIFVMAISWIGSSAANEAVLTENIPVTIQVDQGQLLRLDSSATSVFMAQPEIADIQMKSPRLLYIYGKQPGQTSLFVMGGEQRIVLARKVVVTQNVEGLNAVLEEASVGGNPDISPFQGGLALSGRVPDATAALQTEQMAKSYAGEGGALINRLNIAGGQQVHLRVKVAEVSRSASKKFGFRWEQIFNRGDGSLAWGFGADIILDEVGAVTRGTDGMIAGNFSDGVITGRGVLEALEDEGLVSVLAEPNLTAISGETASFLAGGEVPIPIPSGLGTVGVEYKNYGVSLSFTPLVLNNNRISLRVRPEVSSLSASSTTIAGYNVPSLTTRRAETTVELASGQSFAIGGLLQRDLNQSFSKFPGLAHLPILGALFRSNQFRNQESELVIIVTPYIVRPVTMAGLAMPNDGFQPATDKERLVYGRLYRNRIASGLNRPTGPGGGGLAGSAGFIIE